MRQIYILFILFFLVVLEGVSQDFLPESIISSDIMIVPHWIFVFLVLVSTFYDENSSYFSVILAIIFGLLIDIVYTDILGVYMIAYTITLFVHQKIARLFQSNFFMTFLFTLISILIADHIIYFLYLTIGKISLSWSDYSLLRLLPTIGANLLFLIIAYPISKNRLLAWSGKDEQSTLY